MAVIFESNVNPIYEQIEDTIPDSIMNTDDELYVYVIHYRPKLPRYYFTTRMRDIFRKSANLKVQDTMGFYILNKHESELIDRYLDHPPYPTSIPFSGFKYFEYNNLPLVKIPHKHMNGDTIWSKVVDPIHVIDMQYVEKFKLGTLGANNG